MPRLSGCPRACGEGEAWASPPAHAPALGRLKSLGRFVPGGSPQPLGNLAGARCASGACAAPAAWPAASRRPPARPSFGWWPSSWPFPSTPRRSPSTHPSHLPSRLHRPSRPFPSSTGRWIRTGLSAPSPHAASPALSRPASPEIRESRTLDFSVEPPCPSTWARCQMRLPASGSAPRPASAASSRSASRAATSPNSARASHRVRRSARR